MSTICLRNKQHSGWQSSDIKMNLLLMTLLVGLEAVYCHRVSPQYYPRQYSSTQNHNYYSYGQSAQNRYQYNPHTQQDWFNNKIRWKKNVLNSALQWKANVLQEKARIINNFVQPKLRFKQKILKAKFDLKRNIWSSKRRLIEPLLKGLVEHKINFFRSLFG